MGGGGGGGGGGGERGRRKPAAGKVREVTPVHVNINIGTYSNLTTLCCSTHVVHYVKVIIINPTAQRKWLGHTAVPESV